jgi:hypothetical protein
MSPSCERGPGVWQVCGTDFQVRPVPLLSVLPWPGQKARTDLEERPTVIDRTRTDL